MTTSSAAGSRRPERREELLRAAVDHVLTHGIATLSLRPLAAALGTSDRMLLYWFGSRDALVLAVLGDVGRRLEDLLAQVLPARRLPPGPLVDAVWKAMKDPAAQPYLRLYLEVSGLSARGEAPYATVAATMADGWITWLRERLDVPTAQRQPAAVGVLTVVDGLLLVRFVHSTEAADRAMTWLRRRLA